jgi:bifunctional DNA-binding transcriptional regulator/antitoxin component of YhaV-PrlF toxin-antitoxin module
VNVVIKPKGEIVLPPSVQRKARIKPGDLLELKVSGGVITILPKLPSADGDYTVIQRRKVDAELAESLVEVHKRVLSPRFNSAGDMLASLKTSAKRWSCKTPSR